MLDAAEKFEQDESMSQDDWLGTVGSLELLMQSKLGYAGSHHKQEL